jgi:hypothetical protein
MPSPFLSPTGTTSVEVMGNMKRVFLRLALTVLVAITAVTWMSFIAVPKALAAPGLSVDGALVNITLSPGQNYIHTMQITSGSSYAMDMKVEARGFGQTLDGSNIELIPQDDNGVYSARSFISNIDKTSFRLEPGTSQQVKATITIPNGTTPGTRYAIIYVYSQANGNDKVGLVVAADIPVIISIPGLEPGKTGDITDLRISEIQSGQPVEALTTFKNTGNYLYKVKGKVSVTDASGSTVYQTDIPLTASSILPTFSRTIHTGIYSSDPAKTLPAGTYQVETTITLDDGTVLDTQKTSFNLAESYQPSSAPTQAPTATQSIQSSVTSLPSAATPPAATTKGISWSLAGIIIVGIVVVGAIIISLVVTRRREPTN